MITQTKILIIFGTGLLLIASLIVVTVLVVKKHNETVALPTLAAECEISPFGTEPTPLLVTSNQYVYPKKAGQNTIKFLAGETIDFACPGGKIVTDGTVTNLEVATASCVSGARFIVNNARFLWRQITCTVNPEPTARYTGRACVKDGREIEIGFSITSSRFIRTMLVCFDQTRETTLFSNVELVPAINQQIRGVARPFWSQGSGFFKQNNVNSLYTLRNQRKTINKLLGLAATDTKYIQNNNYFLSRGHLTARSDQFYAAAQNTTFFFLNALPQWQTLNGFNWEQAEKDVQDYAEKNNALLQIWTGGHNVTTLPHSSSSVDTPLYLSVNGNQRTLPVPEYYWKVVYNPNTQRGVALISINNPYKALANIIKFCEDKSDLLGWLNWQKNNQERGFSWACTVTDFKRIVTAAPNLQIKGLLI